MAASAPVPRLDDLVDRRVLVVDDDPVVVGVVCDYLLAAGLRVERAGDGAAALESVRRGPPDLVVLDRMLPGTDGLEACRRIRASGHDVPILLLSALGATEDRIAGLEAGADDYLTKPFSPRELVLRVASVLRRHLSAPSREAAVTVGMFLLDPAKREIARDGVPLTLTQREYDLLAYLLTNPDRTFSRAELLRAVWRWEHGDQSTVTVHIRRLRERVEDDPARPRLLETVWGVGYRLASEAAG